MKHTYLDRALQTVHDTFEVDGLTELVLNRDDKIICYAQLKDPSKITLHVLAGDPSWIGLDTDKLQQNVLSCKPVTYKHHGTDDRPWLKRK